MRARNRLPAETIDLYLDGYNVAVSLAYGPETGKPRELVFVKRPGKDGSRLADLFHDMGIQLSRIIQRRCPVTGDDNAGQDDDCVDVFLDGGRHSVCLTRKSGVVRGIRFLSPDDDAHLKVLLKDLSEQLTRVLCGQHPLEGC